MAGGSPGHGWANPEHGWGNPESAMQNKSNRICAMFEILNIKIVQLIYAVA